MAIKHFILATAGHVDHGKSALVKALTGIDPDRLPEEKARGITIDLGFAHLELPAPDGKGAPGSVERDSFHLGIVDVPGHEDFVKNMVAGVGSIDLALFVVAADDGWMPQSEEHLQILSYLGVKRAVIALTKIDLVEGAEEKAEAGVRQALLDSPFADAPMVKTSVLSGRGVEPLKTALATVLAALPPPLDLGKPRLPVDRAFSLQGIGTVVTGTLNGGTLSRGQAVVVQPSGRTARIRSIQSHNHEVESSGPGTRTALNLPDLAVVSKTSHDGIGRGEIVTLAELGTTCATADVLLERSPRLSNSAPAARRPIKNGTMVRVHHGSANYTARILLLDTTQLLPGERALARLRFEFPVFVFAGDRFIIRDWPEQTTLAGGSVLDSDSSSTELNSESQRTFLQCRAQTLGDAYAFANSQLARDYVVLRSGLLVKSQFSSGEIETAVQRLLTEHRAVLADAWLLEATWWKKLQLKAAGLIELAHRQHPEWSGMPLAALRGLLAEELVHAGLFDSLLGELYRGDFLPVGTSIRHRHHYPALPPHLQAVGTRVRAALAAKPLEPPSRKELAPDVLSQQALRFLLETGQAIEIGPEAVLLAEAFTGAVAVIKSRIAERGPASVSDLRQVVGSSRRIMVPLLERLDRDGVTLRQGDKRVLRKDSPSKGAF